MANVGSHQWARAGHEPRTPNPEGTPPNRESPNAPNLIYRTPNARRIAVSGCWLLEQQSDVSRITYHVSRLTTASREKQHGGWLEFD